MPVLDADTVLNNQPSNHPQQIWSIAAEYVAALNTKYQEWGRPITHNIHIYTPSFSSFFLLHCFGARIKFVDHDTRMIRKITY